MRGIIITVLICCWSIWSYGAFEIAPIIVQMSPGGPGATASVEIINSDDTKTPVQIGIYKRQPDILGKENYDKLQDMGENFQIFPAQVILNPKEKRTVRITYIGNPKIERELAFRIIAEEFPINVSDPTQVKKKAVASISLVTRYIGSLYVTPNQAKPDLEFSAKLVKSKPANEMVLTVENRGSSHAIIRTPNFKFAVKDKEYELPVDLVTKIGSNNILAGKVRKFIIPWPGNVPMGPVKVSLDMAKQ